MNVVAYLLLVAVVCGVGGVICMRSRHRAERLCGVAALVVAAFAIVVLVRRWSDSPPDNAAVVAEACALASGGDQFAAHDHLHEIARQRTIGLDGADTVLVYGRLLDEATALCPDAWQP